MHVILVTCFKTPWSSQFVSQSVAKVMEISGSGYLEGNPICRFWIQSLLSPFLDLPSFLQISWYVPWFVKEIGVKLSKFLSLLFDCRQSQLLITSHLLFRRFQTSFEKDLCKNLTFHLRSGRGGKESSPFLLTRANSWQTLVKTRTKGKFYQFWSNSQLGKSW